MTNQYKLRSIPNGIWSGTMPVPAIGDRVHIRFNGFGRGTVISYFIESGWIGVEVECDRRPAWHIAQNGDRHPHPFVFGAELRSMEDDR